jgi:hypothetical protein
VNKTIREKEKKNREPKKSTGRDGEITNSEPNKQLERKRKKIPGSGTIEFQS